MEKARRSKERRAFFIVRMIAAPKASLRSVGASDPGLTQQRSDLTQ